MAAPRTNYNLMYSLHFSAHKATLPDVGILVIFCQDPPLHTPRFPRACAPLKRMSFSFISASLVLGAGRPQPPPILTIVLHTSSPALLGPERDREISLLLLLPPKAGRGALIDPPQPGRKRLLDGRTDETPLTLPYPTPPQNLERKAFFLPLPLPHAMAQSSVRPSVYPCAAVRRLCFAAAAVRCEGGIAFFPLLISCCACVLLEGGVIHFRVGVLP